MSSNRAEPAPDIPPDRSGIQVIKNSKAGLLSPSQRWLLGGMSVCFLIGFGLAASVEPDPRGYGTHQQFGFPPCTFQTVFGVPCPSCGGTTCVAYFVRGAWWQSLRVNAGVFCLAAVCALYVPWSVCCLWRGRLCGIRSPIPAVMWIMILLSGIAVLQWLFRLLLR